MKPENQYSTHKDNFLASCGVRIKEYPPLISIGAIIDDMLLGAKSLKTVKKRLKELNVQLLPYDMVQTAELFAAMLPKGSQEIKVEITQRQTGDFNIPRK